MSASSRRVLNGYIDVANAQSVNIIIACHGTPPALAAVVQQRVDGTNRYNTVGSTTTGTSNEPVQVTVVISGWDTRAEYTDTSIADTSIADTVNATAIVRGNQ